jgi:DNA-binding SARP family transcriptional activator
VEFRILGPLEVRDGERVLSLGGAKRRAVLALLLLEANRVVSVEQLVDGVWGEAPPPSVAASLHNHLARLRRELGDRLERRPPGYQLRVADGELDVDRFTRLVQEAQGAEPGVAADRLAEALALWRGPPLADLGDEPVAALAGHLGELRVVALENRIDADLALGRHAELLPELDELVTREPYRERLRRQLILALYRAGRQADALEAYAQARRAFVDELGTEPGRELQELQRAVLNRESTLDAPAQVEPVRARPRRPEERRTVTVLAADVTPADLPDDPEARRRLLRERSAEAAAVLEAHGATAQSVGSGRLLGVFGVPAARDDDALQAARAALALRASGRIGLATGEVVTGDPLVSGPPVEEATSLRERAASGEALVGPRTWRLVRHAATGSWRDGAWELEGVDPDAAPLLRWLETPIVGRDRELEQILEPFERALAESRPHLVTVYGAPGVGKTRLAIECIERLAPRTVSSVGRCRAAASDAPYAPLEELLEGLAGEDLDRWIDGRLDPPLAGWLSAAIGRQGESGRPEETGWAARRLLAGLARERPLLVVLDDLHWAAPALLDLVESLVELAAAPVLVLCLARPDLLDVRPQWGGGRLSSSSVLLDALSQRDADVLLELLAQRGDLEPEVRERILAVADGNPLFIEQLLAAALEGEVDAVPDSIQTLLAARLDRLDAGDRLVIQAASVCGTSFTTEDVSALVDADPSSSLVTLVRRELVRPGEADDPAGAGWSFRHSLIRDVAYGSLTKRTRADLHERLAARAIELGKDPDVTAGHHLDEAVRARRDTGERGAELDRLAARAAEHLARAGIAAHARHELVGAASLLGRANALLSRESPERLALVPKLAAAMVSCGEVDAARDLLADAASVAAELGDEHLAAGMRVSTDLALLWTPAGRPTEQILADLDEAVLVLEQASDYESLAWAEILRFQANDRIGSLTETEWLSLAVEHARRVGAVHLEDFALSWICITLHRGPVPVGEAIARATEIRDSSTSTYVRASADGALGILRAMNGELDAARSLVASVAETLEELGLHQAASAHSIAVAEVEAMAGDDEAAERILRDGLTAVTAIGDEHSTKNIAWRLGLALARQGRADEAEPFVAVARDPDQQSFWVAVWWRVVLARIEAQRGAAARVQELVDEARERMTLLEESGMHVDALLESAEALRAAGLDSSHLVTEAGAIAERLGYVLAVRRADEAQRALTA